jgi:hypothetical protein
VAADGSRTATWRKSLITEERVELPPDEVMALFDEPWPAVAVAEDEAPYDSIPLALAPAVYQDEPLAPLPENVQFGYPGQYALSGGLLGGGELVDGAFTFRLWLVYDPIFQRSQGSGDNYSEIDGMGLLVQWDYDGVEQEGAAIDFSGVEPYVSESSQVEPVSNSMSSANFAGLHLPSGVIPDWRAADAHLRYVLKTQLPDGSLAGAALVFTLQRETEGFRPVDIRLEPLNAVELSGPTSSEVSEPPFPVLSVGQVYPDLSEIEGLLTRRQKKIAGGAGWIHQVIRNYSAGGAAFEPQTHDYRTESWLQLDYLGNVIASITREISDDGRILQQTVMQEGFVYNDITGESVPVQPYALKTDWGLLDSLVQTARSGKQVIREEETINGQPAWVFVFEEYCDPAVDFGDGALVVKLDTRSAVNAESGAFLYTELVKTFEDGSQTLVWRQTVETEERVDLPPDEMLALFHQEQAGYTPAAPTGTQAAAGGDFAGSILRLVSIPGDDFNQPSFWYGDIYAGETYLGRVDFGSTPGGWCARSADGEVLAFKRETIQNSRTTSTTLNWFRSSDVTQVYVAAATLEPRSMLSWSPGGELLAFSACQVDESGCGLYILDGMTNTVRMLAEVEMSLWEPLWKPDGTQVAVISEETMYVVEVASGAVVYSGPFDTETWSPAADSPVADWGVKFARAWEGGNCFEK